jgi:hydrogenase maturation factor HypE
VHYEGEIEGEVKDFEFFAKNVGCTGKAGVGSRADNDFKIEKSVFKLFDDGLGSVDFSDADGVEPDTFFFGKLTIDYTKSLVPAGTVAIVLYCPIYDDGAEGGGGQ